MTLLALACSLAFAAPGAGGEIAFDGGKRFKLPPAASRAQAEGLRLLGEGSFDEAVRAFNRSLKLAKKNPGARANRGVALSQLGRLDEALKDFEAAAALAPELRERLKGASVETRVRRSKSRLAGGNVKGALDDLFIAIRIDRQDWRPHAAVAEIGLQTRRYDACVAYATRALDLGADSAEPLFTRARCLTALGRKEEALKDFDRLLVLEPKRGEFYLGRAEIELDLHHRAAAKKDAKRAVEDDPALAERVPAALR